MAEPTNTEIVERLRERVRQESLSRPLPPESEAELDLLRLAAERLKNLMATVSRMDAANIAALEKVGAWDDPGGFNGVVSNIERLGARTLSEDECKRLERIADTIEQDGDLLQSTPIFLRYLATKGRA